MTLRFGIIGCGDIGQLRAEAIHATPSTTLTAVSDVDSNRAASLASSYSAQVASDWHELVRRDDVDAMLVCTPPSLHAQMCTEALDAHKHVLCEKPLARNPVECRAILDAAQRSGCIVATGFNYRFYPSIMKARQLLDSGIIGKLDHIRSYTGYMATAHSHPWMHEFETMGGGSLRDNGIHLIDLTCYFLGDVAHAQGLGSNAVWQFDGCEDNGFLLLKNKAGNIATVQASWTEWRGYRLLIELYGHLGCIRASCFPMWTQVIWSDKLGGKTQRKRHLFPYTHLMEHLRSYRWVVVQSFIHELDSLARAVRGEETQLAIGHDGALAIEAAHAASENDTPPPESKRPS